MRLHMTALRAGKGWLGAALALALLLCACAGGQKAAYTVEDADVLLAQEGLFDEHMAPVDSAIAAVLYGLDGETVVDCVSYQSTSTSVSADELTVFVLNSEAAAETVEEVCRLRVVRQIAVCESYCPAAVPRLEGAVISRLGSTVLFAVGDPDRLPAAVEGLTK